jgi:hypothetical protein
MQICRPSGVSNQNWLDCLITAPKSGKRKIKLSASKNAMRHSARAAANSAFAMVIANGPPLKLRNDGQVNYPRIAKVGLRNIVISLSDL